MNALDPRLQLLQTKVQHWRKQGPPRRRIPTALWDEAVEVAKVVGVHQTAKALRFNHADMKNRMKKADGSGSTSLSIPEHAAQLGFVQIAVPPMAPMHDMHDSKSQEPTKLLVQFVKPSGQRMTMQFNDACTQDILTLIKACWAGAS